jgi:hypothetical protein
MSALEPSPTLACPPAFALDERTLGNHYDLAYEGGELTRWLCRDAGARSWQLDFRALGAPRFLADYEYPVSPWPVLISAHTRQRFAALVERVPSLIRRAVLRFYRDDLAGFAAHYRLPEVAYRLLEETPEEAQRMIVRYDLAFVQGALRILEVNVGSQCGGWQTGWLWPQLAERAARHGGIAPARLGHTSAMEAFCRYLHERVQAHLGPRAVGRTLIVMEHAFVERGFHEDLAQSYAHVVGQLPHAGRLAFDTRLDDLRVNADGRVEHRGHVVDCVVSTADVPRSAGPIVAGLARAHLQGRVFFPDHPLHMLLGDKGNLALLHTCKTAGWLTPEDAHLVDEYVPWAAALTGGVVERRGEVARVHELAARRQDELVLKRGVSRQGNDVFVGRFLPRHEWLQAVAAAGDDGTWLLQDYCQSDRLYAPRAGDVVAHDAVWGIFGFGREYGGGFGRLMAAGGGQGVINSARGAQEFVMLDVAPPPEPPPTVVTL